MFYICHGSCENRFNYAYAAGHIVDELRAVAFVRLGDMPYTNQGATCWGSTTSGVDKDSTVNDFLAIYLQSDSNPGMQYIDAHCDSFRMIDDHEMGGNGWDYTYTFAELNGSPLGTTNDLAGQNERNEHMWRAIQAFQQYSLDNPVNNDSGVTAERARGATLFGANPAVSQFPPLYFRFGYDANGIRNDSSPFVECFVIDCITHRDPLQASDRLTLGIDDAEATMLGAVQRNWLLSRLAASTATFKIIFSGKKLFRNSHSDNADIWPIMSGGTFPSAGFESERDYILDAIESASGWSVPGGVAWISGDRHVSCVDVKYTANGASWDVVNVTSGVWNKPGVTGIQDDTQTVYFDNTKMSFGAIGISEDRMELSIRNSLDGRIMWRGYVMAGENKLSYPVIEAAI